MIALLKWEAAILNHLYKTQKFSSIVINSTNVQDINYKHIYSLASTFNNNLNQELSNQLVQTAQKICLSKLQSTLLKDEILKMESILSQIQKQKNVSSENNMKPQPQKKIQSMKISNQFQNSQGSYQIGHTQSYSIEHVIIYSSLSKCRIWPKMLKFSINLVPSLINLYNSFSKDFRNDLFYKYDPVILTNKYQRIYNKIQVEKKSFLALFDAIKVNDIDSTVKLIKQSQQGQKAKKNIMKNLNEYKYQDKHISHFAVIHSDLPMIKTLYQLGANFELLDSQDQTAIFHAVKRGDCEILEYLVETVKVNINHLESQNRTPIYLGAFEGNLKVVNYLYSKGANPEMESKLSRTPLSKACYLGNISVAEYLIKIGVSLTTIDSKGRTALHNAAWGIQGGRKGKKSGSLLLEDSPQCVKLLLDSGHPIQFQDFDGFTPLFSAVASFAIKSIRILVEYGANLKHKTKRNESIVFVAAKYGHLGSIKIMIQQFNCEYLSQTIDGYTPLDASFSINDPKVCFYLLGLYFEEKRPLTLNKVIDCTKEYSKQSHLKYICDWAGNDEIKRQYIFDSLLKECSIQNQNQEGSCMLLEHIFKEKHKDFAEAFLQMLLQVKIIGRLPKEILQNIIQKSAELYKQGLLAGFPQFLFKINEFIIEKGIKLDNFQIEKESKEESIIKLLSIDSSITQSNQSVHRLLFFLIKRRMTKVLLWIFTLQEHLPKQEKYQKGIYKFSKKEIEYITLNMTRLNGQEQKMKILDFCFVNGLHDIIKVIQSATDSNLLSKINISIPNYTYSCTFSHSNSPKACLMPVNVQYFDFNKLISSHISEKQAEYYVSLLKHYEKQVKFLQENVQMVQDQESFSKMKSHFQGCKIIGVDVEHYSTPNQQFVCLIQLSGIGSTFLLDTILFDRETIAKYLKQLMSDVTIIKILHSHDHDLKWINEDFLVERFQSIVDTSKIHAIFNPKQKSPSLKLLAERVLNQYISKDYQRSDWRIRPLFKQMRQYAAADAYLLPFIFLKQLMEANCELGNVKDHEYFQSFKKHFGLKKYVKSKGRHNIVKVKNSNQIKHKKIDEI